MMIWGGLKGVHFVLRGREGRVCVCVSSRETQWENSGQRVEGCGRGGGGEVAL
jgi:hypothetical protein